MNKNKYNPSSLSKKVVLDTIKFRLDYDPKALEELLRGLHPEISPEKITQLVQQYLPGAKNSLERYTQPIVIELGTCALEEVVFDIENEISKINRYSKF